MYVTTPFTIAIKQVLHPIIVSSTIICCNIDISQEMFAFPYSYLVFDYGYTSIQSDKQTIQPPKVYIKPPRTHCITVSKKATGKYVVLVLQPDSFYQITKLNANEHIYGYLPLQNFVDAEVVDALYKSVHKANSPEKVVELFNYYLERYFKNWQQPLPVKNALQLIAEQTTTSSLLNKVTKTLPYSVSTINRYFKKYIGTTVGEYIRLVKFNSVINLLTRGKITLKDIIAVFDYYDQTHLSKDFKKFTGISPKQYRGKNYELLHKIFTKTDDILHIPNKKE